MDTLKIFRSICLLGFLFIIYACASRKPTNFIYGSFKDERDGQVYKTIVIGKQVWMQENLNFATKHGSLDYDKDPANAKLYGKLYNYSALPDACPAGWHAPSLTHKLLLDYTTPQCR